MFASSVCSVLLLVIVVFLSRRPSGVKEARRKLGIIVVVAIVLAPIALTISWVTLLQLLLLYAAANVCVWLRAAPKTFVRASLLVSAGVYVWFLAGAIEEKWEFQQARERFPYESIADRLSFEQEGAADQAGVVVASPLLERLESSLEEDWRNPVKSRGRALEFVHRETVDHFERAFGFGVGRMASYALEPIPYLHDLPPAGPIPVAEPPTAPPYPALGLEDEEGDRPIATTPSEKSLEVLHVDSFVDFVNPAGFGHVEDRTRVAGFQSHHFRKLPVVESGAEWRITRLELVSLLKHVPPAVYVSKNLPNLEQLDDVPIRPLNAFEDQSLGRIREGEDLVVEEGRNRIVMFGSLRAVAKCLECHSVSRGALLGAFSYELMRNNPVPEPPQGPETPKV